MEHGVHLFVEKMGLLFEGLGISRSAGRISAWLMVTEQPQSLDDITKALGISKASVSTNTRLLESYGMVEKVGVRGDRKTYYQTVDGFWKTVLYASTSGKIQAFINVIRDGQRLVDEDNTVAQERLARLEKAYSLFGQKAIQWAKELEEELRD